MPNAAKFPSELQLYVKKIKWDGPALGNPEYIRSINTIVLTFTSLVMAGLDQSYIPIISTWSAARYHQHYNKVIIGAMAPQTASVSIVHSTICSGTDLRKHQSFGSLTFVRGILRWPVNSPHKGAVTRKCFHLMTSSRISSVKQLNWGWP